MESPELVNGAVPQELAAAEPPEVVAGPDESIRHRENVVVRAPFWRRRRSRLSLVAITRSSHITSGTGGRSKQILGNGARLCARYSRA